MTTISIQAPTPRMLALLQRPPPSGGGGAFDALASMGMFCSASTKTRFKAQACLDRKSLRLVVLFYLVGLVRPTLRRRGDCGQMKFR
jgi:hypothetical protein